MSWKRLKTLVINNLFNNKKILIAILVCQLAGAVGSIFTAPSISTWYVSLQKPFFTPPNWVFGPVWITLYFLMGVSAFLVWNGGFESKEVRRALSIFGVQLVLNVLWSFLFFGLHSPLYGFIGIVLLWVAIAFTIFEFFKISKKAGLMFIPYIVWVSIAAALNYYVWVLNP